MSSRALVTLRATSTSSGYGRPVTRYSDTWSYCSTAGCCPGRLRNVSSPGSEKICSNLRRWLRRTANRGESATGASWFTCQSSRQPASRCIALRPPAGWLAKLYRTRNYHPDTYVSRVVEINPSSGYCRDDLSSVISELGRWSRPGQQRRDWPHRTSNPQVAGSSPAGRTSRSRLLVACGNFAEGRDSAVGSEPRAPHVNCADSPLSNRTCVLPDAACGRPMPAVFRGFGI